MFKMADSFDAARNGTLQAGDNVRETRKTMPYVYGSRQPNVNQGTKVPAYHERDSDYPRQQMG